MVDRTVGQYELSSACRKSPTSAPNEAQKSSACRKSPRSAPTEAQKSSACPKSPLCTLLSFSRTYFRARAHT